jgi:aspartyl protease family protein
MGRIYLICILLLGMFSCAISRGGHRAPSARSAFDGFADSSGYASRAGTGERSESRIPAGGGVELERSSDGHFYADVEINGTRIHALVDTGATGVALSREDAHSAGVATSIGMNEVVGEGADGAVHGEVVTLDRIQLGEKSAEKMPAIVLNSGGQSLLGQQFLSKFDTVQIQGDKMVLR